LLLVISVLGGNHIVDIPLHDTYHVISSIYIGLAMSILLGGIGFGYWLMRKYKLISWMTKFHIIATTVFFLAYAIIDLLLVNQFKTNFNILNITNQIFLALLLIAMFSQLIFILNLSLSYTKYNKINNHE